MSDKKNGWSRRYEAALGKYIAQGPAANLQAAHRLGRQAAALGLETLDVARKHEQVLMTVVLPGSSPGTMQRMIERAKQFFTETIVPIEKTHRAAVETEIRVDQLTQTLRRRTADSFASTHRLARGIARRQAAEASLKMSGINRARLLKESSRLQNRLRDQTRKILLAQENEKRDSSHQLHDEIAQTLLAIEVRLLTLKNAARSGAEDLKKEIAETQRLVKQSVKTIRRLAHEFGGDHET